MVVIKKTLAKNKKNKIKVILLTHSRRIKLKVFDMLIKIKYNK
jgi:hypothetical protein